MKRRGFLYYSFLTLGIGGSIYHGVPDFPSLIAYVSAIAALGLIVTKYQETL